MIKVRTWGDNAVIIDERKKEIQYYRKDEKGDETKMNKDEIREFLKYII